MKTNREKRHNRCQRYENKYVSKLTTSWHQRTKVLEISITGNNERRDDLFATERKRWNNRSFDWQIGTIEAKSRSRPTFDDGISTSVSNLFPLIVALPSNFVTAKINHAYNSINPWTLVKIRKIHFIVSCARSVSCRPSLEVWTTDIKLTMKLPEKWNSKKCE